MKLSRRSVTRINTAIDDWVPPRLRDSRAAAWAARRLYGPLPIPIDRLKDEAFELSAESYAGFYRALESRVDLGTSDMTPGCFDAVVAAVEASEAATVLDVACGKGELAGRLSSGRTVVGCDVALHTGDRALGHAGFALCEGLVEHLPFRDGAFDTVVSTHTLEHVRDLQAALSELRRVTARRLVIVVPRQRPYRVTFNPHLHFFPYRFSVLAWTGTARPHRCDLVDGDWLYIEDQR